MKTTSDKSVQRERKMSGISIARKSFSPGRNGIAYPDSYSVIKGNELRWTEFEIGNYETLTLFSKELAEYVQKIEKGGLA